MKVQRISLRSYRSSANLSDESVKLDVYFSNKDGNYYVWTPAWAKGTKALFSEVNRILGVPEKQKTSIRLSEIKIEDTPKEDEKNEPIADFQLLAIQLGKALGNKVTSKKIESTAKSIFEFESKLHKDSGMEYLNSQNIYDWIMTLRGQPMSNGKKMELLRRFIASLAPKDSPLAKLREGNT